MNKLYIEDAEYQGIDYTKIHLEVGEYSTCTFLNCTFSNTDLSNFDFEECVFRDCDFSLAKINNTSFREVKFVSCKLLGLHFDDCRKFLFAVSFEGCQLNLSSFFKVNLKNTLFVNCSLKEVDFTEANLTSSLLDNCDLLGATFDHTVLEKSDFRSSHNYSINPEINRLKSAKFSLLGVVGLLDKYHIVVE